MILGRECTVANAPLDAERRLLERWTGGAGASAFERLLDEPAA
jgi:hypothetical protein